MPKPNTALLCDFPPEKRQGFITDLRALLSFEEPEIVRMLGALVRLSEPGVSEAERRDIKRDLYAQSDRPQYRVDAALSVAKYLLVHLVALEETEPDRSPDAEALGWGKDLELSQELAPSEIAGLNALVPLFLRSLARMRGAERRRLATDGVLPLFKSIDTTVGLRAVLDRRFRFGDDLKKFAPNIQNLVPVISVSLGIETVPVQEVAFQIDPTTLQQLIDVLQAALRTAGALKGLTGTVVSYSDSDEEKRPKEKGS